MKSIDFDLDNDKIFCRYIYNNIRDEKKNLWITMFSVLSISILAISYIINQADSAVIFSQSKFLLILLRQIS